MKYSGVHATRKRFAHFMRGLIASKEQVRILVIGSNSDGTIPAVEDEARAVATQLENWFKCFKIEPAPHIECLVGDAANYERMRKELAHPFHMIHFAGHGRFNSQEAGLSGLVVKRTESSDDRYLISARELRQLLENAEHATQFIFLSCCLSARQNDQTGAGDYFGIYDATARTHAKCRRISVVSE